MISADTIQMASLKFYPPLTNTWTANNSWQALYTPTENEQGYVDVFTYDAVGSLHRYQEFFYIKYAPTLISVSETASYLTATRYAQLQNSSGSIQILHNTTLTAGQTVTMHSKIRIK